jgi:hypothetical protein
VFFFVSCAAPPVITSLPPSFPFVRVQQLEKHKNTSTFTFDVALTHRLQFPPSMVRRDERKVVRCLCFGPKQTNATTLEATGAAVRPRSPPSTLRGFNRRACYNETLTTLCVCFFRLRVFGGLEECALLAARGR